MVVTQLSSIPFVLILISIRLSRMAERAHPDDPFFQSGRWIRWRRGFIPWPNFTGSPYRRAFQWRYQWANDFCSGKDVVDVPCGMGWGTSMLDKSKTLLGLDVDAEAIGEAEKRYGGTAQFRVGDMAALPLGDKEADVVVCLEGIEHIPENVAKTFVRECHRVLRNEGVLLLSSPFCSDGTHSGNPFHLKEYQPDEIKSLIGECFDIKSEVERHVDKMTVLYLHCTRKHTPPKT